MEIAAALVNTLRQKLHQALPDARLSDKDVEDVFAEVQANRFDRAADSVKKGRTSKAISTQDTLLSRFFVHIILAWFGDLLIMALVLNNYKNSVVIKDLNIPKR